MLIFKRKQQFAYISTLKVEKNIIAIFTSENTSLGGLSDWCNDAYPLNRQTRIKWHINLTQNHIMQICADKSY